LFWAFEHRSHLCRSLSIFVSVPLLLLPLSGAKASTLKTQSPGVFPAKLLGIEHVRNGFICHCSLAFLFWFFPLINGSVFRL
jgi:hypothetical protein